MSCWLDPTDVPTSRYQDRVDRRKLMIVFSASGCAVFAADDLLSAPIGGALTALGTWCPFVANAVLCGLESLFSLRIRRYWRRPEETGDTTDEDRHWARTLFHESFRGLAWLLTSRFQRRLTLSSATTFACFNAFLIITMLFINKSTGNAVTSGSSPC